MGEQEFIDNIKKVSETRNHKITNSWGVYDAYKYYRKNKPAQKQFILSESQYFAIIRKLNSLMVDSLYKGHDIILPSRMGKIEIRKYPVIYKRENGKIKVNLPINWDATLRLWYEDNEAFKDKTLVKVVEKELFKIKYTIDNAMFINKSFYQFFPNRELKVGLKRIIKTTNFDAFKL